MAHRQQVPSGFVAHRKRKSFDERPEADDYIIKGGLKREDLVKFGALAVLVIQNSALALAMRYSRTVDGSLYPTSTAVVVSEVLKLLTATLLVMFEEKGVRALWTKLHKEIILRSGEFAKLLVASILYTIQNNLQYIAVSNLDAANYQVLYQLKILTTALFSVMMLSKQLNLSKWVALIVLVIGVSLVQLSGRRSTSSSTEKTNNVVGLISVLLACCSSGFAGVYFEKVLKGSNDVSVWVRNIELALIGIFVGLAGVWYNDAEIVRANGFFHGYSTIVWGVIALQALGGIVVALVVKYADNLLKGFATSISIIISCLISSALFGETQLCYYFISGTMLVILSTMMYSTNPADLLRSDSTLMLFSPIKAKKSPTTSDPLADSINKSSPA